MLSMFSTEVHYCNDFHENVKSNYKNAVVVFDGCEGGRPSMKYTAHLRRTGGCTEHSCQIHRRHDPNVSVSSKWVHPPPRENFFERANPGHPGNFFI